MSEQKEEYKIKDRPATIFRVVKSPDNPYVMVDMCPILNDKLSWKAKGILVYLLSRPDGWEVNLVDLTNRSSDGLASVKSGCKELKEAGHLKHAGIRKASGQFDTVIWEVYEEPQVGVSPEDDFPSPEVEKPHVEKPHAVNHTQVLKTLSNKDINKINDDEKNSPKVVTDTDFGKVCTEWQALHGILTQPDSLFLGEILDDWREHVKKLPPGHPDYDRFAADVVMSAVRITVGNCQNQRSQAYTKAIIKSWIQNGYGWKPVNNHQPCGPKYPKQESTVERIMRS